MAKNQSLLTQALSFPTKNRRRNGFTDEEIELALAWAEDKINLTQVSKVLGVKGTSSAPYTFLACALRQFLQATKEGK